jgi:ABC-type dipeptide/oligopeptide/nickel transport system permease subunit
LNQTPPQTAREIAVASLADREHRSLWGDAWRRLISSNTARLGMAVVLFFTLSAAISHFAWDYDPRTDLDYTLKLKPPNLAPTDEVESIHPFGTDKLGRDIFRRVAHGGWNSLRVGLVAVGVALSIGGLLGLLAGFYESMPMGVTEQALVSGAIGLVLGGLAAWIAGQLLLAILFCLLGGVAPFVEEVLARRDLPPALARLGGVRQGASVEPVAGEGPRALTRTLRWAGAGLVLGVAPVLPVNLHVAVLCGFLGASTGLLIAVSLGGSLLSDIIMRLMDVLLAFPGILLAIAIVAMLGPGLDKGMIAIGVVNIPIYARLMRSTVLAVVQQEYVVAAQMVGVGQGRMLFRHIFPNTLSPIIVQATMGLAGAILSAAAAWWAVVFPGLAIMLSVLGFNLLGDGLRDALDPKLVTD